MTHISLYNVRTPYIKRARNRLQSSIDTNTNEIDLNEIA